MNLDDRDVDKFYNLYRKIDKDNGGYIDIQEFYRYFNLNRRFRRSNISGHGWRWIGVTSVWSSLSGQFL